jgi:DUF917 family protein
LSQVQEQVLQIDDIEAMAVGTWILGTGGGGSPYLNLLNIRELYAAGRRVILKDPMTLPDDALVAVLSSQGAPLIGQERLADSAMAMKPLRIMEEYLGRKFDALMPVEIGGGNGLHAIMVAAATGLPAIDADAMGRAYPEAQMTSFAVADLQCYPLAISDIRDNEVIIHKAHSWKWMERISRRICTEFGSQASTCKAPRSGKEVRDHGILYTGSKAISLGKAVLKARQNHVNPVDAILDECWGNRVFTGKVTDVERRTTGGFLRGRTVLEGLGENTGEKFDLDFQNEFSVGSRNGEAIVMTPDLICVVDSISGDGIGTESIRYGQRVDVLALPAPEVFLSARGLELVGPRAFGFDFDYRSYFKDRK